MAFPVLFVLSTFLLHFTAGKGYEKFEGQFLDISAKGNSLWAVFCNNTVLRANLGGDGSFQSWTAVPTTGIPAGQKIISLGASPDGTTFAVTDAYDNNIFSYRADTSSWRANARLVAGAGVGSTADQVSSGGIDIVIGMNRNKDGVWGLAWREWGIVGLGLKGNWAAIGTDKSRWIVDTSGRIKRCVASEETMAKVAWQSWCPSTIWEVMCLSAVETVEVQNKDRAVVTNAFGEIFTWDGKEWSQVPYSGRATRASVSEKWAYWKNEKGEAFYGRY